MLKIILFIFYFIFILLKTSEGVLESKNESNTSPTKSPTATTKQEDDDKENVPILANLPDEIKKGKIPENQKIKSEFIFKTPEKIKKEKNVKKLKKNKKIKIKKNSRATRRFALEGENSEGNKENKDVNSPIKDEKNESTKMENLNDEEIEVTTPEEWKIVPEKVDFSFYPKEENQKASEKLIEKEKGENSKTKDSEINLFCDEELDLNEDY